METWLAPSLIVLAASSLQAATGFGFSVMATPFLLLVFEAHTAIQINIILSLLISVVMVPRIGSEIDKALLFRLVKGAVIGAPVGLGIFVFLDATLLKIVTSIIILFLTGLLILNFTIKQSSRKDATAGGFSGILTTSLGMPGPPLLLYFVGAEMDKSVLRSTTLAFFLFVYSSSLLLQVMTGSSNIKTWLTALALAPVALAGIALGQFLFRYINQRAFLIITYVILGATGTHLLVNSL